MICLLLRAAGAAAELADTTALAREFDALEAALAIEATTDQALTDKRSTSGMIGQGG